MSIPQPESIRLPAAYDACLAGVTVSPFGIDRFVYSLRKLIRFEMMRCQVPASEAREIISNEFIIPLSREHGDCCPVFLNDEVVDGSVEDTEKPLIILPPNFNGKEH